MARRRLLLDVSPLRASRDFRLLFAGQLISFMGSQLTVVAVAYQVYLLTRSSLQVGLVSMAQLGPLIAGSLVGGAIADSTDRRRLLLWMQVALALTAVGLAVNASLAQPAVWPLYVLTALTAAFSGLDRPARNAAIPNLVPRGSLPAAYALMQVQMQVGLTAGPALAGILLGRAGLATVFWIDVATFVVAFAAVAGVRPLPPEGGGVRASAASIVEGVRFIKGNRLLAGTFVIDLDAMVFGMPRALFPALGTGLYGGGAQTVGLLYAAPGAGALLGALLTGWVSNVRRQGLAVVVSVAVWGLAVAAFGLVSWLPLGLFLLALAGAADMVSAVFRNTILQLSVPDSLRGRLSSAHIAVVTGGPRLGDAEAGAVAALAGPRVSAVSGGLACAVGVAVIARLFPELVRYRSDDPERAPVP
ncbi:MAG: MFS transporter [Actinomycetota bacterium]|nr:MFS transporter [Actinomycetota bacterium]